MTKTLLISVCLLAAVLRRGVHAQTAPLPDAAQIGVLVQKVAHDQEVNMEQLKPAFDFLSRRVDSKGDVLRHVIESTDGNVARTIQKNGKPLDAEADAAERERVQDITAASLQRKKHSETGDKYGRELIRAMPRAMIYTLTPGQPQIAGFNHPVLVLDYAPDPNFKPQGTAESLLTGLDGRIWIDRTDQQMVRIHIHIHKDLNYALGLVAHIYNGGTLDVDLRQMYGRAFYTRVALDLSIRELMVHTQQIKQVVTTGEVHPLPNVPSTAEAVKMLLSH